MTERDSFTPQAVLDALIRLRGAGEGRIAYWWLTETVYGVVADRITPLYTGQIGILVRTVRNADGSYALTQLETGFWTALDGATELKTFKNPYTGADNPMPPLNVGPHTVRLTTAGTEPPAATPGGKMRFTSRHGPVTQVGDDVFISTDVSADLTFDDPATPPRSVNDLSTYQGRLSDLGQPAAAFVPSWVTMQLINGWPPNLAMGGRDGHVVVRGSGAKVPGIEAMPGLWRRLVARDVPNLLKDPAAVLSGPAAKLG